MNSKAQSPASAPRRTRRSLTKEELRIWRAHIETTDVLQSRLQSRLQSESSLSSSDYQVMLVLSEAENRMLRSSELAAQAGWERSRLSHHLGRMEKRGLIRRDACSDDNRGAWVVLTEAGLESFRRGSVPHLVAVRELFVDAFTPEELSVIGTLTAKLQSHLGLDPRG